MFSIPITMFSVGSYNIPSYPDESGLRGPASEGKNCAGSRYLVIDEEMGKNRSMQM